MKKVLNVLTILAALTFAFFLYSAQVYGGLPEAQRIVDEDHTITAYKVFTVSLPDPKNAQQQVVKRYKLPLLVPMPNKVDYASAGQRISQNTALLQFLKPDRSVVVTFLLTFPDLEPIALAYRNGATGHIYHYEYINGEPKACGKERLKEIIDRRLGVPVKE
jgi:hypothetical protein